MRKAGVFLCLFVMFVSLITFQPMTSSAKESTSEVNEKPKVVPSLREWKEGTGSFNISKKSRIVIDLQYSEELKKQQTCLKLICNKPKT